MDLVSGQPFWFYKNGFVTSYEAVEKDLKAEVVIMGGGITGAIVAWHLSNAGFDVVVVEKRHIGMGSTSASTALLQYEIDTMLTDLIPLIGEKKAVASYLACVEAIYKVQKIAKSLATPVDFALKKSLYYASVKKDISSLKKEFKARKDIGIDVEWWDKDSLKAKFPGLKKSGAIWSNDAAQMDPYRFTHAVFEEIAKKNAVRIFDTVAVTKMATNRSGVKLKLDNGSIISAKKLIVASGYESQNYLSKTVIRLHSTYAIVSKPMDRGGELWHQNALLWESARPYLYLRTTNDQRVMIGGKDEMFKSAVKRDKLFNAKSRGLQKQADKMFPELNFIKDYEWCGTFAETHDGLPFIGKVKEWDNTYFILGFGGNGILFSIIGAQIIDDLLHGKRNPMAEIFSFDRIR